MADPAVKLTKPQWLLLVDIDEGGGRFRCADTYAPAKKLTALGLVEMTSGRYGNASFALSDKGRALLDALKDEGEGR